MNQTIKINKLISKGVRIGNPLSIEIGSDIDTDRISPNGVIIHSGCRIFGSSTLISAGAILGSESPVTIKDCKLGCNVKLKGGYFENSVFLDEVNAAAGCHVRSGSILEESVSIAHNVGLKQTILFPFVKIGSHVDFCDCFMSGGTSNVNHSEVGSSYIHFNYTPHQDKATPSLMGEVANGVMLKQKPIFLGGQGGIVGPCRISYGTVIAAGSVYRKDQLKKNRLVCAVPKFTRSTKYSSEIYHSVGRQALNNIIYIANLLALFCWYKNIRILFVKDDFTMHIFEALLETLEFDITERINKFEEFCKKLKHSSYLCKNLSDRNYSPIILQQKKELYTNMHLASETVYNFLKEIKSGAKNNYQFIFSVADQIIKESPKYLDVIRGLNSDLTTLGTTWLQQIVDEVVNSLLFFFPSIKTGKK